MFLHLNTARDYWYSTFVCSVREVSMYLIRNWFRLLARIPKNTFLSTFNNNIVQKSFKSDESSEWSTLWQWGNSLPKGRRFFLHTIFGSLKRRILNFSQFLGSAAFPPGWVNPLTLGCCALCGGGPLPTPFGAFSLPDRLTPGKLNNHLKVFFVNLTLSFSHFPLFLCWALRSV